MGRNKEALAEAERARKIDPLRTLENFAPGAILVFLHRWDQAIQQMRVAIDLDLDHWFDHCFLGRADEQKKKFPEAIAGFQRALALDKSQAESWSGLGHAFAISGNKPEAQKVLTYLTDLSRHSYVAPYDIAVVYAGWGTKNKRFPGYSARPRTGLTCPRFVVRPTPA